jgi:hypothetical protein
MSIRERVLLPLYRDDERGPEPTFELGSLFLNVILFETVIVPSLALLDVAALARAIGVGRTVELLKSGVVKIRAAADALGSLEFLDGTLVQLQHLSATDPEDAFRRYVDDAFAKAGFKRDEVETLEVATRAQWIRPDAQDRWGTDAIADTVKEAVSDSPVFHSALTHVLKEHGIDLEVRRGQVHVEVVDTATNIMKFRSEIPHLSPALATKVIRRACSVIANLNGAFERMKRDQAVTALSDDSTRLMEAKLEYLWRAARPDDPVAQFHRVIAVAGLPSFDEAVNEGSIDIERLLEVRTTPECREFREFLTRAAALDDKELAERLKSLRARLGTFLKSGAGKTLRMLATTAAGFIAAGPIGAAAGVAASGADSFVLERIFPSSGVVTFVGQQYPSIFRH